MKIIALVGSPHGTQGNTARLTRLVLAGAEGEGADTETLYLKGDTVLPCLGCDICHKKGYCGQKDEFAAIREKILQADALVLASPNYISSVSAQLKAFMDRCCGVVHCLGFEGKYGASVVTSGGGNESSITDYMNQFLMITGIRPVGAVWATMANITGESFPEDISQKARALGKDLVGAWQSQTVLPETETTIKEFAERMRNLIRNHKEEWSYEYEHWQKRCRDFQ